MRRRRRGRSKQRLRTRGKSTSGLPKSSVTSARIPCNGLFQGGSVSQTLTSRRPFTVIPSESAGNRNATLTNVTTKGVMPKRGFAKTTPRTALVVVGMGPTGRCLQGFCLCPPRTRTFRRGSIVVTVTFTVSRTGGLGVPLSVYLKVKDDRNTRLKAGTLDRCISCITGFSRMSMSITTKGRKGAEGRDAKVFSRKERRVIARLHMTRERRNFAVRF